MPDTLIAAATRIIYFIDGFVAPQGSLCRVIGDRPKCGCADDPHCEVTLFLNHAYPGLAVMFADGETRFVNPGDVAVQP